MGLYFSVFKFYGSRWILYRTELFSIILRKLVSLGFLILFWSIIAESGQLDRGFKELAAYFLVADGLSTLLISFRLELGKSIRHAVRDGVISNYFIKPVSIIPYMLSATYGNNMANNVIAAISVIFGILLFDSVGVVSMILFGITLISAFGISVAINMVEGSLSFLITETTGIKNAIRHVIRIFSGLLVPLYFFPDQLRQIADLTPFPAMIYGPTLALQTNELTPEITTILVTGIFWAIVLNILILLLWRKVVKSYEAVGI